MSVPRPGAIPQSTDDPVKIARPRANVPRFPQRSPRRRRQQQARKEQRVAVHHPLHAGDAGTEALRHVGQRHVHDRGVEHGHEVAQTDGDEDAGVGDAQRIRFSP